MSLYRPLSAIRRLVIHCADTPDGKPVTAEDIDGWHGERGFRRSDDARWGRGHWQGEGRHAGDLAHIGYHFVIRVNGVVEVGRRLTEVGAHVRGHNSDTISICLIGRRSFTLRQWEVLDKHVTSTQAGRQRLGLAPVEVVGHRHLDHRKGCPGFDVPTWLAVEMAPLDGYILEAA